MVPSKYAKNTLINKTQQQKEKENEETENNNNKNSFPLQVLHREKVRLA